MNDLKTALQEKSYKTLVDAYKHMGCDADTEKTMAIGYWRVVEAFIDHFKNTNLNLIARVPRTLDRYSKVSLDTSIKYETLLRPQYKACFPTWYYRVLGRLSFKSAI